MPLSTSQAAGPADFTSSRQVGLPKPIAKPDKHIWGIYVALIILSIVELYSASSREVATSTIGVFGPLVRHMAMLGLGFLCILGLQRIHYRHFYSWSVIFVFLSVVAMVYCMFFGDIINGARRSFSLLGFSIQPSEMLKISAVFIIAIVAHRTQMKGGGVTNTGVTVMAAMVMLFGGMLIKQGLTNTLLLMGISISMFLISGVQWKKLGVVIVVYAMCFGAFMLINKSGSGDEEPVAKEMVHEADKANGTSGKRQGTWAKRLERYFDNQPKYLKEINAQNRQEMYSYMAQANGGVFGVFPGNSRETARLPLAFSDYIYSIIIEDMGLIGGLAVLVLYLWLMARASGIAARCTRAFPAFLVLGMAVMIVIQALFHIAIVTGVFPVSGQPLPLISKGGSSILVTSIAFGIMLSVSRHTARTGKKDAVKAEIEALPEDLRTVNPTQL